MTKVLITVDRPKRLYTCCHPVQKHPGNARNHDNIIGEKDNQGSKAFKGLTLLLF